MLETMEKLNTSMQADTATQSRMVIQEVKQSFLQKVKAEFNLVRIPIPG
jgi:hypothetical protein